MFLYFCYYAMFATFPATNSPLLLKVRTEMVTAPSRACPVFGIVSSPAACFPVNDPLLEL